MDSINQERIASSTGPGNSPAAASATPPHAGAKTITPLTPGFDLASVQCSAESQLHDLIWKDEDLSSRMKELSQERDEAKLQDRLGLMTDAYQVDQAITPKLFELGTMLTKVLRLALPLDVFVRRSEEMNAFCLASRRGNRLVMCLHSSLVNTLNRPELLFCMGHEVGHALWKHADTPVVSFDNPHFSPMEVARLRALNRAREISCDRIGLLACQDVRVASRALFQIASGLTEKWLSFDEAAYARHFDELSSLAEVIDLEDASRTHPFDPLRVKALIAFSKSATYAEALGKTTAAIPTAEMEKCVEGMLSVLNPDLSELESAKEEDAANQFLFHGALLITGADNEVDNQKVAWVKDHFETELSHEEIAHRMSQSDCLEPLFPKLESSAHVLKNKLSELKRADILHKMCDLAVCGGTLPDEEMKALDHLRRLLDIRPEIAEEVLQDSKNQQAEGVETDGEAEANEDEGDEDAGELSRLPVPSRRFSDVGQENVLAAIRQVFSTGGPRDRETAIQDVLRLFPQGRLTPRNRDDIDNALTTAARRGIVCTEGGLLHPDCRTIGDYPRELLKKHLVGVMKGSWWEEDEAIRAAARYLGFSKAGTNIQAEFRSAIRGALRQGLLERDGAMIRRAR